MRMNAANLVSRLERVADTPLGSVARVPSTSAGGRALSLTSSRRPSTKPLEYVIREAVRSLTRTNASSSGNMCSSSSTACGGV